MGIHVSEPGRPMGTRLPEVFRKRRVGTVEEPREIGRLRESNEEISDARFQQARQATARRAVAQYGQADDAEPEPERAYLPVGRISSSRLHSLSADSTLADALEEMEQHGVHHLVITADDLVGGLVDTRWILGWLHENRDRGPDESFQSIELPAFLTASPETDAHQLARLMLAHQLDAALVVEADGTPSGLITSTDYLRLYASLSQQEGEV
ncbi:CBS domain-containing protein [Marinobacter daqiaonensis]|uniref:CBS domain-containing protein n=1 Tax=Marinobacter daqiaonensis TaxID=650891 RepID=A0A1I6GMJ9_9GAMM|nr:CBS domain-containing protein [Marinobacter daqiaonensis]SFR43445.1 CBS domain-containing protein [Marinobacter daqiaonensis]